MRSNSVVRYGHLKPNNSFSLKVVAIRLGWIIDRKSNATSNRTRNGSRTNFKLNFRHVIPLQKKQGLILWVCFCLIVGIAFLGAKLLEKCRKSRNQRNDRKVVTSNSKLHCYYRTDSILLTIQTACDTVHSYFSSVLRMRYSHFQIR